MGTFRFKNIPSKARDPYHREKLEVGVYPVVSRVCIGIGRRPALKRSAVGDQFNLGVALDPKAFLA